MNEFTLAIFSALFGVLITELYLRLMRNPKIKVEIGETADGANDEHRFLHIKVLNIQRKGIRRLVSGNTTTGLIKAKIFLLDPSTKTDLIKYDGRWSSKAEPLGDLDYVTATGAFDPSRAIEAEVEIILPGEEKSLTIAVKHKGEKEFYGFNNWSYGVGIDRWRKQDWKIEETSVVCQVKLFSEKGIIKKEFVILNPNSNIKSFHISRSTNGTK